MMIWLLIMVISFKGDSGGPLARENEKSGRWYLIGKLIHSFEEEFN